MIGRMSEAGPLSVARDMRGLLADLHHQHRVLARVELPQQRGVQIQLIAEHDSEDADAPLHGGLES